MKLEPGMGRSKSPFHSSAGCISSLHQRFYLLAHALSIRQPPVQTLARQDGEFYLRHILHLQETFSDVVKTDKTGLSKTAHTRWMISAFANFLPGSTIFRLA